MGVYGEAEHCSKASVLSGVTSNDGASLGWDQSVLELELMIRGERGERRRRVLFFCKRLFFDIHDGILWSFKVVMATGGGRGSTGDSRLGTSRKKGVNVVGQG